MMIVRHIGFIGFTRISDIRGHSIKVFSGRIIAPQFAATVWASSHFQAVVSA